MYAVIFRAEMAELDEHYERMASRMRHIAMTEYGCREFTSCTEGDREIAISYWDSEEQIKRWKQNAEHLSMQDKGRSSWYSNYTVEVVKLVRSYGHNDGRDHGGYDRVLD